MHSIFKMFHLLNSLYGMNDYWIEGIGSVYRYGLLYPLKPYIVLDGSTPYFGCFTHDTISYFVDSTCLGDCPCTDWLVEIMENVINDSEIVIFPNPTKNSLTIEFVCSKNHYESIVGCLFRSPFLSSSAFHAGKRQPAPSSLLVLI